MRRARRKAGNKDKVFGCDLLEHLSASSQEVPQVLRSCSEFIEEHGVVDGIYRLSGVSSNIQKLRNEFDTEGIPDLNKDIYQQDIHCVSSLCKAYFRELPNPLLTYQLYDKFAEAVAIQLEEDRLVKIRDVLKDLPPLHHRTLEVLMRHLVKMASYSSQTNMHSRNLAIVWAPNLLRSKDIEASGFNGTAAFMEVRVQSIVVEFILTHVPQLFPEHGVSSERRKSLPSPSVLSNQEETLFRTVPFHFPTNIGNISPGDGPLSIRSYHSIIEGTDKRKGSLKGRKWKSIFNLGGRIPDPRRRHKNSTKEKEKPTLRPAKSMDSLSCDMGAYPLEVSRQRPPSSHISPLAMVSSAPQASSEGGAPGTSAGPSGYAVTYRRGAGACVSVVSGGGGVQGTYSLLDSGGAGGNGTDAAPTQNRSPGPGSKAGRRAGMHITGPLSVTVPLHITSGLALGMLGGGGDRAPTRTTQWIGGAEEEGREGGGSKGSGADKLDGDVEPNEEKVEFVEGKQVSEDRDGEEEEIGEKEVPLEIESVAVRDKGSEESLKKEQAVASSSPSVQEINEENRAGVEHQSGENSEEEEDLDNDSDEEYVEMRGAQALNVDASDSASTPPNTPGPPERSSSHPSTDLDEDNLELSEYVQDNFDFLDHMDSSFSNQMLEFSVEAPYLDEEVYEDREELLPQDPQHRAEPAVQLTEDSHIASTAETSTPKKSQTHLHRPLTVDRYVLPNKSLSLPYTTSPFFLTQFSSDEEEDADADEDYSNDEENDMFYKSLPAGLFQHLSGPDIEDASDQPPIMSPLDDHIAELSPADQSEPSDVREPQLLEQESSAFSGDPKRHEMDAKGSLENKNLSDTQIETLEQSTESEDTGQSTIPLEVDTSLEDSTSKCSTMDYVNPLPTGTADQNGEVRDSITDVEDVMELYESHHSEDGESESSHTDEGDEPIAEATEIPGFHVCDTVPQEVNSVKQNLESPEDQLDPRSQFESKEGLERRNESDNEKDEVSREENKKDEVSGEENEKDEVNGEENEKDEISGEENEKDEVSVRMRRASKRENVVEVVAQMEESDQQEQNGGERQRELEEELVKEETERQDGPCAKAISDTDSMKTSGDENCKEDGEENDSDENDWSANNVVMETMQVAFKVEEEKKREDRVAKDEGEDESGTIVKAPEHMGTGEELPVWVEPQNEITPENTFSENSFKRQDVEVEKENQTPECQVNCTQKEIVSLPQEERDLNDSEEQHKELRDKGQRETANEIPQTLSTFEENAVDLKEIQTENVTLSEVKRAERADVQRTETGQGRVLVISKQSPAKVYQVRSVPIVPPKPQHCKLTALSLRQQQQERERRESCLDREDDNQVKATGGTNSGKETETDIKLDVCKSIESEQGGQEEMDEDKKGREGSKISEGEKRLRDGDDRGMKETPKNISVSMCFDEAVAMVTMKRGREKENIERDKDKERRDMKLSSLEK